MREITKIDLESPWEADTPLPVVIHAADEIRPLVHLIIGDQPAMSIDLTITPRSARELGYRLVASAEAVESTDPSDPTVDAPPLTDDDAPEDVEYA